MPDQDELTRLIANHHRRLQKLKEKHLLKGSDAEPDLLLAIEDIEAEIQELQAKLDSTVTVADPPAPPTLMLSRRRFEEYQKSQSGPVIERAGNIPLSPEEEAVLQRMFRTCSRVAVDAEFGSGLSGGRVFRVWPIEAGQKAPFLTVVKIGPYGLILQEVQAYQEWVEFSLPRTAARLGSWRTLSPDEPWGGLSYELVGSGIFNVWRLSEYYDQASAEDLVWVLKERLFPIMGRRWWLDNRADYAFHLRAAYDDLLPVNLLLSVSGALAGSEAQLIEPDNLPPAGLTAGESVQLQGFVVTEVDLARGQVTLNLPHPPQEQLRSSYRLRLAQVPDIDRYQVGQFLLDPIQSVVTQTRRDLLERQVQQALGQAIDLSQERLARPDGGSLANPLLAYQAILDTFLEVNLSTIHGDLNLENILVDPNTRDVSLIDFATVRRDHTLRDFLRLETEVVTKLFSAALIGADLPPETIYSFYQQLHQATFQPDPWAEPHPDHPDLAKPFAMLTAIRTEARKCLFNPDDATEYYRALVIYLLGALKFKNLDDIPQAKAVAFWGAAAIVEVLTATREGEKRQPPHDRQPSPQQSGQTAAPIARDVRPQPTSERAQIEQGIAAMEAQRAILGDAVVEASIATLREKLATLEREAKPVEQQRKQATIFFADVSGFTAMSETMDIEEVSEMMNTLWERLDKAIVDHGGRIDKHIGDAVMAIWGIETAREDDPERAVRAALAMQQELGAWSLEMKGSPIFTLKSPISIRIGLNTGPTLLGPVGTTGEYTAMGDTVNVASRLEQAAPVGGILISHDTYQQVRGVFDVQALEPIQVKGKRDSLQVYLVERAKPRAFRIRRRGVEGIDTRMIGRDAELKQLQDALYTAMEDSERQVLTLIGEAGVGKSRLLYEFDNWLELLPETVRYFKGRARLETQKLPYALIRDLFAFRFQIQESDPVELVQQKMKQGLMEALGETDGAEMQAHFIGQLLGFDFSDSPHLQALQNDAQQLHDRALIYLSDYFKATAAQETTAILLEDIHWADNSSLDLLNHLALTTANQRLLIVCSTRPTLFERRPHWGEGQSFHARLELTPLSKRDSRRLVAEVLQKMTKIPDDLRDLVVSRAEGNPYYLEELVKMLIEDAVIIKAEPYWRVEMDRLAEARVPATLTGILQARLDSLSGEERLILQQASVVGRTFWDSALARLNQSKAEAIAGSELQQMLSTLRDKEMIFRRESSAFAGAQEFIFKHALLREVTYESVLKRLRRSYHALVAEWLMAHTGEGTGEYTGLVADHLERSGQTTQAVTYLRQAGERAAAQFANAEAVAYFSRALDLTPETEPVDRYALLLAREMIHNLQGERKAQEEDLAALRRVAESLADDERLAEVALRQANYATVTGDYPATIAAAQEAIGLAQKSGAVNKEAAGNLHWGWALWSQGDYPAAQARLEQALTLAQAAQMHEVEADSLRHLGVISLRQGDDAAAKACFEQALQIWNEIGYRRGEGIALNDLGNLCLRQRDYAGARVYYEQALHLRREIGHRHGEGIVLNNLGDVSLRLDDFAAAQTYYEQSLHVCREIGDRRGEGFGLNNLGNLSLGLGDYAEAQASFEQALKLRREIGDRRGEGIVCNNLGDVYLRLGDYAGARSSFEQFLHICRETGDREREGYALTNLGHALTGLEQLVEAAAAYEQALALRRELGQPPLVMESLAGLAQVSLAQGELAQARTQVEEILSYLEINTLDGIEDPFRVYLTCYRVLQTNQDARASAMLNTAYSQLEERAVKIGDHALRQKFLKNVTIHREIIAAWKARDTAS